MTTPDNPDQHRGLDQLRPAPASPVDTPGFAPRQYPFLLGVGPIILGFGLSGGLAGFLAGVFVLGTWALLSPLYILAISGVGIAALGLSGLPAALVFSGLFTICAVVVSYRNGQRRQFAGGVGTACLLLGGLTTLGLGQWSLLGGVGLLVGTTAVGSYLLHRISIVTVILHADSQTSKPDTTQSES